MTTEVRTQETGTDGRTRSRLLSSLALGVLLAALMSAVMMLAAGQARASTTFTVINTNDSGAGSLRQAIADANATSGADTINFAIPGTGVHTIAPTSALPEITEAVSINGYTQPGAHPNTKAVGSDAVLKIELSGANTGNGHGLLISASNSTVKGLVINRWSNSGIIISGPDAVGNKVAGNYLGTDASGTKDLGNSDYGLYVIDASNNAIGGTTAAERNVVSGNDHSGVLIYGSDAKNNKVTGNYIGTDKNGAATLGNGKEGVFIGYSSENTLGGTSSGARNVIADNAGSGVVIYGDGATGNRLLQNSIFANAALGVDLLGTAGRTANDVGDADTGPNGLQNKPAISSAKTGSLKTTIRGKLNSAPSRTFAVRFFSNPSGGDEGKTFIGQTSVTTDGSGIASFAFSPASKVGLGRTITATATDAGGSTSEFSAPRTVVAP